MKKTLLLCSIFSIVLLMTTAATAQMKIGYFDEESILPLFPGIQKVDTMLQAYMVDSLKPEYEYELSELVRKEAAYKKDSATQSPGLRNIAEKEIGQHRYKLTNWQQYQNQLLQQKQQQLLKPYLEKVYAALREIIAEQKYTHVLKSDVFLLAPPPDNLALKVALKLNLQLPKEVLEQLRTQQMESNPSQNPKQAPTSAPKKK